VNLVASPLAQCSPWNSQAAFSESELGKKGELIMRKLWSLLAIICLSLVSSTALAQDVLTKGSIGGTVTDATGAAVPGAKVTVTGQTGERTETSNESGVFRVDNLTPGTYTVKVEQTGFKTSIANSVTVNVGKESTLNLKLETGEISATVDVTATAGGIDQQSTGTGQNLNDQLFQNVPVQRGVSSLFYLSPGATDSINGGRDNPSIAGGSALDNLYVADGVNITNSAFGGIGTFSRSYGALGTGINTSFIKEVQVKTGGFEPQYGQSEGGIINIITQSGGNAYHGAVYGFARPSSFEATRRQADDLRVNKQGKLLHEENYDVGRRRRWLCAGHEEQSLLLRIVQPNHTSRDRAGCIRERERHCRRQWRYRQFRLVQPARRVRTSLPNLQLRRKA
jgi:hypothetical protein